MNQTKSESLLDQTIEGFWESIPPVWHTIRGQVRVIASEQFNLSVDQFHILRRIRKGSHSVSDLATDFQISRSAISQSIDLMVEKGLVTRTEQVKDRRFVQIELTPEGDTLLNAIFKQNRAWMKTKMIGLTEPELLAIEKAMLLLKTTFLENKE
jgi:DNA-binding MarR family transcriptional regulator